MEGGCGGEGAGELVVEMGGNMLALLMDLFARENVKMWFRI